MRPTAARAWGDAPGDAWRDAEAMTAAAWASVVKGRSPDWWTIRGGSAGRAETQGVTKGPGAAGNASAWPAGNKLAGRIRHKLGGVAWHRGYAPVGRRAARDAGG